MTQLPGRPVYLAFLPDFLFSTDPVPARYIGRAWLLMAVPSLVLSALASLARPELGPTPPVLTPLMGLILIILVPVVETLLLVGPLLLLNRLVGPGFAVAASAIFWGAMHSLVNTPTHGLIAWWPFLIMAIAFLTWSQRGFLKAGLVVAIMHGLQNSVVVFFLLLLQLAGAA